MSATPRRWLWVLGLLVLLLLVNLPPLHSSWTRGQVESDGVDASADVVGVREVGSAGEGTYFVAYRLPEGIDESRRQYAARVDEATYELADATGTLPVRVLPGDPSAHLVEGAVRSRVGLAVVLAADAVLLGIVGLMWWHRRRGGRGSGPRPMRLVALGDVQRCKPGSRVLERDGEFEVVGEVTAISDTEVVLQAGEQTVVVALGGYELRVGHQQPAWVWGRPG